jgi:transcriptional adapter 1
MDLLARSDNCKILSAKHDLMVSLGDDWDRYLNYLKNWFRGKLTKNEFDRQTRFFLTKQQIFFHNKFILEILNKIECVDASAVPQVPVKASVKEEHETSTTHSTKKRKKTTQLVREVDAFHPYSPADFVREVDAFKDPSKVIYNNTNVPTIRYAAQELFLSDQSLVMGRFLVGAWENGLMNVEDVAIEMVVQAVQVILKNILSSCIRRRSHYKVTSNSFYYDIGATLKDPTIRNTISRQKADDDTLELSSKELFSNLSTRKFNDDSVFLADCER